MANTFQLVSETPSQAIEVYNNHYDNILAASLDPSKGKYSKEFYAHLGKEVEDQDLEKFIVLKASQLT